MLHQVQGGYYVKGFGKHGAAAQPARLRLLRPRPVPGLQGRPRHLRRHRLPGRRVPARVPRPVHRRQPALQRRLLAQAGAGTAPASRPGTAATSWSPTTPGSGRSTCSSGPDGSVYVADWYDRRAAHLDPVDNWDKTNGRVLQDRVQGHAEAAGVRPAHERLARAGRTAQAPQQVVAERGPPAARRAQGRDRAADAEALGGRGDRAAGARSAVGREPVRRLRRRVRPRTADASERARARLGGPACRRQAGGVAGDLLAVGEPGRPRVEPGRAGAAGLHRPAARPPAGGGSGRAAGAQPRVRAATPSCRCSSGGPSRGR